MDVEGTCKMYVGNGEFVLVKGAKTTISDAVMKANE